MSGSTLPAKLIRRPRPLELIGRLQPDSSRASSPTPVSSRALRSRGSSGDNDNRRSPHLDRPLQIPRSLLLTNENSQTMTPKTRKRLGAKRPPSVDSPVRSVVVAPSKVALLVLSAVVIVAYLRTFWAGFLGFDDNLHVYANPYLNPPSFAGIAALWRHPYESLYIPVAYTILAGISVPAQVPATMVPSIGHAVTVSPAAFHIASVGFHVANTLLCYLFALQVARRQSVAVFCSLLFATHPLQVESVAWISELRGLSSACFALVALNVFIASRQASQRSPRKARALFVASAALVIAAMLCKPSAVVLPLLVFAIDRVALGSSWRSSGLAASIWGMCVLPWAWITRSIQHVSPEGLSVWWQRAFIAGDAVTFYLFKAVLPINLCVDYGRTPGVAMSHGWSYLVWVVPMGLLVLCYVYRQKRPVAWLGSIAFVVLLLPVLGLIPFKYQAFSTVADRYVYLPLIGLGLVFGDLIDAIGSKVATGAALAVILILAIVSFAQTGHWLNNLAFVRHIIDVNPDVAFAQNDLGGILLREGRVEEAVAHFNKAVVLQPAFSSAHNNLGLALVQQGRLDEAEVHFRKAVEFNPEYFKAYESLGAIYLRTDRLDAAIASLQAALAIQPSDAKALNDLGVAFMQSGRPSDGLAAFQRAVDIEPTNATYRNNLGRALLNAGRAQEAATYLAPER